MGLALEDKDGFVKFLVNKKSRKILGCHIIGSQASILIHEVLVAMRSNEGLNTIDNITRAVHIHPALRSGCKSSSRYSKKDIEVQTHGNA
jgi:mycothione reductase